MKGQGEPESHCTLTLGAPCVSPPCPELRVSKACAQAPCPSRRRCARRHSHGQSCGWLTRGKCPVADATVTAMQSFHFCCWRGTGLKGRAAAAVLTQGQPAYLDGRGKMRHLDPQPKRRGTGGGSGGSTRCERPLSSPLLPCDLRGDPDHQMKSRRPWKMYGKGAPWPREAHCGAGGWQPPPRPSPHADAGPRSPGLPVFQEKPEIQVFI